MLLIDNLIIIFGRIIIGIVIESTMICMFSNELIDLSIYDGRFAPLRS